MENENWIEEGFDLFTKVFMKYDLLGRKPLDIGNGLKINASNMHTIEAIGKGHANTVTLLSEHFLITKGAVSQVIAKLHKDGYIKKNKSNNKTVLLGLTKQGKTALKAHDKYNEKMVRKVQVIESKYEKKELDTFLKILKEVDNVFGIFIEENK